MKDVQRMCSSMRNGVVFFLQRSLQGSTRKTLNQEKTLMKSTVVGVNVQTIHLNRDKRIQW